MGTLSELKAWIFPGHDASATRVDLPVALQTNFLPHGVDPGRICRETFPERLHGP
jgi:hypothetical protein